MKNSILERVIQIQPIIKLAADQTAASKSRTDKALSTMFRDLETFMEEIEEEMKKQKVETADLYNSAIRVQTWIKANPTKATIEQTTVEDFDQAIINLKISKNENQSS